MFLSPIRRSLRAKLVFASVVVEVAMLAVLVANSLRVTENSLVDLAALRLNEVQHLLNAALAAPLVQRDLATLQEIMDESRREEGIVYLVLHDELDRPLAASGWDLREPLPPLSQDISPRAAAAQGRLDSAVPIAVAGIPYGTLRFGVSTQFLADARERLLSESLGIAAGEILLSIAVLTLLGVYLTRHLQALTAASARMAAGDTQVSIPVATADEVGQLSHAFNTMALAIRARIEELTISERRVHDKLIELHQAQTEQQRLLVSSEAEHARLRSLLAALRRGILFVTPEDTVIYHNPSFGRIWHIDSAENLAGRKVSEVLRVAQTQPVGGEEAISQVFSLADADQDRDFPVNDGRVITRFGYPVLDERGERIGHIWICEDVTAQRQTSQQLIYLAERDALTGLFNRRRFQEELGRALYSAARRGSQGAVLFFDLDEFKYINDTLGHHAGDTMLIRVAQEVGTMIRHSECFSRIGGDEFAVLMPDAGREDAEQLAARIVRAIGQIPVRFDGRSLRLTTSIGIAFYPEHGMDQEELVARADAAMYQAKASGKNAWRIYRADLDASQSMLDRLSWLRRLDIALETGLLRLHYQGIYDAQTLQLCHIEALVRMVDEADQQTLILPAQFIAIAEKSGRIVDVDRWVVRAVAQALASEPAFAQASISVNISGRSFDDLSLSQYIFDELQRHQIAPERLIVEVTETAAISDLDDAQRFIAALRERGCRVCLDDFGAGFSSFTYLKHLGADILKIDGQFIQAMAHDKQDQIFVKAIVDVARGLGKRTVAEFVEDASTHELLREMGVDMVQGYHLGMPSATPPAARRGAA